MTMRPSHEADRVHLARRSRQSPMSHRTEHSGLCQFPDTRPATGRSVSGCTSGHHSGVGADRGWSSSGSYAFSVVERTLLNHLNDLLPLQIRTRSTVADTTLDSIPQ